MPDRYFLTLSAEQLASVPEELQSLASVSAAPDGKRYLFFYDPLNAYKVAGLVGGTVIRSDANLPFHLVSFSASPGGDIPTLAVPFGSTRVQGYQDPVFKN